MPANGMIERSMTSLDTPISRRGADDEEIVLGVLDAIERDPSITQRSVARELGIALGLANAYLKRCVRKGLVKVSEVPTRRYAYYLTPHGFAEKSRLTAEYLTHSFAFFRRARAQCGELFDLAAARGQKKLALIGSGELAEIASLVAREHEVTIVATLAAHNSREGLSAALKGHPCDGVLITALKGSRDAYLTALDVLGPERVHAPALLRLPPPKLVEGAA